VVHALDHNDNSAVATLRMMCVLMQGGLLPVHDVLPGGGAHDVIHIVSQRAASTWTTALPERGVRPNDDI
jgi:hypothetical protein